MNWYWQALCVATALACGLLIGIERGFDLRGLKAGTRVTGIRTFTLVGLVSGFAGLAGHYGQPFAAGALVAGTAAVLAIGYAHRPGLNKRPDATTPIAALTTVALGFIAGFGQPGFAVAGAAVVTLILALKAELHGFLAYLAHAVRAGIPYRIYGHKGKQVRDNIHSEDVARFMYEFARAPRIAEVYNLGGGKGNACSILEAFRMVENVTGRPMKWRYVDENRAGDHICYYSDLRKMQSHYPEWGITKTLDNIFEEIADSWTNRISVKAG